MNRKRIEVPPAYVFLVLIGSVLGIAALFALTVAYSDLYDRLSSEKTARQRAEQAVLDIQSAQLSAERAATGQVCAGIENAVEGLRGTLARQVGVLTLRLYALEDQCRARQVPVFGKK